MKVYCLFGHVPYEGEVLLKIFASRIQAEIEKERLEKLHAQFKDFILAADYECAKIFEETHGTTYEEYYITSEDVIQ